MADFSRRALVAALPIAAVPVVCATAKSAVASVDPIFAALAAQQVTWDTFGETCKRADKIAAKQEGRTVTTADLAANEAADRADLEAIRMVTTTAPTTIAGVFAALHVINARGDNADLDRMVATILAAPIAGGAHGGRR